MAVIMERRIEIWASLCLENFEVRKKALAWEPRPEHVWSEDLRAPRIHLIHGRWYVYLSARQQGVDPEKRRILVLGQRSSNPMDEGGWQYIGLIGGLMNWHSMDAVVFSPRPFALFCCFAGYHEGNNVAGENDIFVVELASPESSLGFQPTKIACADLEWEITSGSRTSSLSSPSWLRLPGFEGIAYSASGGVDATSSVGLLRLVDAEVTKASSWEKRPTALLAGDDYDNPQDTCFINSPLRDGWVFCVYNASSSISPGCRDPCVRVLCFGHEWFHPLAKTICRAEGRHGDYRSLPGPYQGGWAELFHQQSEKANVPTNTTSYAIPSLGSPKCCDGGRGFVEIWRRVSRRKRYDHHSLPQKAVWA